MAFLFLRPSSKTGGGAPPEDCEEVGRVRVGTTLQWDQARCATGDARLLHLFFSEDPAEIAEAKATCAGCPLRLPCLEGALERREPWGVWGGHLFEKGEVIDRKRGRGRPRKEDVARRADFERQLARELASDVA